MIKLSSLAQVGESHRRRHPFGQLDFQALGIFCLLAIGLVQAVRIQHGDALSFSRVLLIGFFLQAGSMPPTRSLLVMGLVLKGLGMHWWLMDSPLTLRSCGQYRVNASQLRSWCR